MKTRADRDAAGSLGGGASGRRATSLRLTHSPAVTIAAAVVTPSVCAVAADSQHMSIGPGGAQVTSVRKTAGGQACAVTLAGTVTTPSGTLNDALPAVAAAKDVDDAALRLVTAAANVLSGHDQLLADRFEVDDVVWEAVVGGRLRTGETGALLLTGYWTGTRIQLDVATLLAKHDREIVVVLGSPHPRLQHLDIRWHDSYADRLTAAQLTRSLTPRAPQRLDTSKDGAAAALTKAVEDAVAAQAEAERPSWWPAHLPVAAGPVVTDFVNSNTFP
jgi:hypothetical protein